VEQTHSSGVNSSCFTVVTKRLDLLHFYLYGCNTRPPDYLLAKTLNFAEVTCFWISVTMHDTRT